MTRDLTAELKTLRLHGMAGAWADLIEQGSSGSLDASRWLVEHLLQAEATDRAMRSVSHQMTAARFSRCTATSRGSTSKPRRWTPS